MSLDLPPLVFRGEEDLQDWRPVSLGGHADVGYTIEQGPLEGQKVTQWPSTLFGCFTTTDAGWNCFWAHCCCGQVWIYANAYALVGLGNEASAVATTRLLAQGLQNTENDAAKALGSVAGMVGNFQAGGLRYKLFRMLYDEPGTPATYTETGVTTCLAQTCCVPCAVVQEVDAIMVAVRDKTGKQLAYGPCCSRYCCEFVDANSTPPRIIKPRDVAMGWRGPSNARMQRQEWAPTNLMGLTPNAIAQQRGRRDFENWADQRQNQPQAPGY